MDDDGPVLPLVCHAGDLLSRWFRDPDGTKRELNVIASAGYDGVRTWTVLHGNYWRGREVGPMHQDNYWLGVEQFRDELRVRGLRWLLSQGDMLRALPSNEERRVFMQRLAGLFRSEDIIALDAGNEAWQNGETEPLRMIRAIETFMEVTPVPVWSQTSPPGETKDELDLYDGSVFDVHGYRAGHYWDKLRHIFSIAYEGKPSSRLGIQSEPFGFGDLVSASENKHELTPRVMSLACAMSLMSRQMWVYFSGPGVMSDAGQRLEDMPGFLSADYIRSSLPSDLMTFQSLVHGGASQKGRRVFAVPGTDETRADHAIHDDGRFVCIMYGPNWRNVIQEKEARIGQIIECGDAGRIVIGVL